MTIKRIYAENDAVITESESAGIDRTGKEYRNTYCQVYDFVDGKIHAVREYLDTHLTHAYFAEAQAEHLAKAKTS